ncbi:hypothetical protein EDD17DRAFT_1767709 [Pisolithus thermaeus]|nr:hypothetical protein EV401DRAFT_2064048 [Pisolithus croceorrhizus]KAI6146577.1 hypothetical protein EDD17DRAFT_1767709 [Pisolithus thermaeus]
MLEAQWEKAHLHAAQQTRNQQRKKVEALAGVNACSDGAINCTPDQCNVDGNMELTSFLHASMASPTPTLPDLQSSIDKWKSDWGPESIWLKKFNNALHKAHEKGLASTDCFFRECKIHAQEGCCFICFLQQAAGTACSMQWGHQLDIFLQIFDLLDVVLVEVKFFEVKLDEYAPAVPYSKVSDARYYSGM